MFFLQANLVYNVPCAGVVRAKTHCDILQLSKSDTSHVLHHFPDSNATPSSSCSCMLPLFPLPPLPIYHTSPTCTHQSVSIFHLSFTSSSNFPVHYLNFHLPPSCLSQLQTRWRRASKIAVMLPSTRLYQEAVVLTNNSAVWLDWKRTLDPTPAWYRTPGLERVAYNVPLAECKGIHMKS